MRNRLDRRVPGSADVVVDRLAQALQQQGLTITARNTTGEAQQVTMLTVTDPEATRAAVDVDADAATVGSVAISVREVDSGVRITLVDPVTEATLTDEAELLEPAQRVQARIVAALDELADAQPDEEPQIGDAAVRRALLDGIRQTAASLGDLDTQGRADTLFVLAKAYTAIVSLERTQEVELHLA